MNPSATLIEGPLGFPMTDAAAKAVDAVLKTLPQSQDYAYKKSIIAAQTELTPESRTDVSWISTESADRIQDVMIATGMDDKHFAANPLVTLNHDYSKPPVGRSIWRKISRNGQGVQGILAKTHYPARPEDFAGDWPPEAAFEMVKAGLLNAKSIGFLPVKIRYPDAAECQRMNWPANTRVVEEWLLTEYACVYLGTQQDAVVEQVNKSLIPHTTEQTLSAMIDRQVRSLDFQTPIDNTIAKFFGRV